MSRVISATPYLAITRGDDIRVTTGEYRGELGTVICVYRGRVTAHRRDGRAFVVPLVECQKEEAAVVASGLDTTD